MLVQPVKKVGSNIASKEMLTTLVKNRSILTNYWSNISSKDFSPTFTKNYWKYWVNIPKNMLFKIFQLWKKLLKNIGPTFTQKYWMLTTFLKNAGQHFYFKSVENVEWVITGGILIMSR
jgi:hypothetical protein